MNLTPLILVSFSSLIICLLSYRKGYNDGKKDGFYMGKADQLCDDILETLRREKK